MSVTSAGSITEKVRASYARAAQSVLGGGTASCAGGGGGCCGSSDPITRDLYDTEQAGQLPVEAMMASLGCGNPTALADLREGEIVLDLGSGGGIDVLLSARRVGESGHAYGLDMTDEMLELARRNASAANAHNVTFLKGTIEDIPLPDAAVDVIISNCVVNLSADKRSVIAEAFRVLRPGGRLAISDVVTRGPLPRQVTENAEQWASCVGGALDIGEFEAMLTARGFEDVSFEETRVYTPHEAADLTGGALSMNDDTVILSAFVRARKPAA